MNRQNQTRPILSVFTKPNQFSSASESMPAHAESRSWGRTLFLRRLVWRGTRRARSAHRDARLSDETIVSEKRKRQLR
jgi:hypothetical protein